MKILAIERVVDRVTENELQPFFKIEAQKVWELMQAGIIREIYFTKQDHCAVIIFECADEIEAQNILNTLPLVKNKLINFDIKPLVPYDGFSRLFG